MDSFNPSKIELSIKDSTKGQKIAAALYLVTAHLSDSDPLKETLRACAVDLIEQSLTHESNAIALRITEVIQVAVLARLISEKNASIIILELRHFVTLALGGGDSTTDDLRAHFGDTTDQYTSSLNSNKKTYSHSASIGHSVPHSGLRSTSSIATNSVNHVVAKQGIKTDRQAQILSLINERKSAGIKDIAGLFPETSEKTIQRELGALVASGRITKRGQKRWSVYMAVTN